MNKNNFLTAFIAILAFFILLLSCTSTTDAKKSKGLTDDELKQVVENVDKLTKKVYARGLFSPEDNAMLVDVKTKLDSIMSSSFKDPVYAQLFYDTAYVCKEREYNDDAIEYFSLVTEKFAGTSYAKKATKELDVLGMNNNLPQPAPPGAAPQPGAPQATPPAQR